MNLKSRLEKLEEMKAAEEPFVILVRVGNGNYVTNGKEFTPEEVEKLYPNRTTVNVNLKTGGKK